MDEKLQNIFFDSYKVKCDGFFLESREDENAFFEKIKDWNKSLQDLGCSIAERPSSVDEAVKWVENNVLAGNCYVSHPFSKDERTFENDKGEEHEFHRLGYIVIPKDLALKISALGYV